MVDTPVWSDSGVQLCLTDYRADDMGGYVVRLYVNNFTPTPSSSYSLFTEAFWSSYAYQTPTWSAVAMSGDIAYTDSGVLTFPVGAGDGGVTVYGVFVTDPALSDWYHAVKFDTPIVTVGGFDIQLNVRVRVRNP